MIDSLNSLLSSLSFDVRDPDLWSALFSVLMADIVLAGDNAIIIAMAAHGLPARLRRRAILWGLILATGLRIVFSLLTVQLLAIVGLTLAGGLLLLWVAWKMWQELRRAEKTSEITQKTDAASNMRTAMMRIVLADVSMSLDNVLAVAGAAREHTSVLVIGLVISIGLAGFASSFIARLLERHRWLGYVGLTIVAWIAVRMIWDGWNEVGGYIGY